MVKKRLMLLSMWCLVVTYKASRALLAPLEPVWLSWLLLAWTVPSLVRSLTGAPAFAPALHSPTLCCWSWAVLAHAHQGLRECKQADSPEPQHLCEPWIHSHEFHQTALEPGVCCLRLQWSCTACSPEPASRGAAMKRAERRALLPATP